MDLKEICQLIIAQARTIGIEVVRNLDHVEYGKFLEERKEVVKQQLKELEEKKQAKMLRTTTTEKA